MHPLKILVSVALVLCLQSTFAATCSVEDDELRVSGASQCLLMRRFGTGTPDVMLVWLHGDVSAGGAGGRPFSSSLARMW